MTEFLICAPLVALLAFAAYDMNKRIEDQETATILARNAVYLGEGLTPERQLAAAEAAAQAIGNHVDDAERAQLGHAPDGSGSGVVATVTPLSFDDAVYKRLATPDDVHADGTFAQISGATGTLAVDGTKVLGTLEGIGQTARLFMADGARTAGVETTTTGPANLLQTAVATTTRAATHDEAAASEAAGLERRFSGRFYLRGESGYHPSDHKDFDLPGVLLGLTKQDLGDGDDFSDDSDTLQTRCFSRFWQSDSCGGGSGFSLFKSEKDEHIFARNIGALAELKAVLSLISKVTPVSAAADVAFNELAKQLAEQISEEVAKTAVNALVTTMENKVAGEVKSQIDGQLKDLEQKPYSVSDEVLNAMAPNAIGGAVAAGGGDE